MAVDVFKAYFTEEVSGAMLVNHSSVAKVPVECASQV